MRVWLDAQLGPAIARWMSDTLGVDAVALRELGLRDATDPELFEAARAAGTIVLTKDSGFVELLARRGTAATDRVAAVRQHVERSLARDPHARLARRTRAARKGESLVEIGAE